MYQLSRIGTVPLALLFTVLWQKDHYISDSALSAALAATMNLLFATLRAHTRVTWESVLAGIVSSVFAALYPILLLRTFRRVRADMVTPGSRITDEVTVVVETRAYYTTLHYVSLLSILILTPIVLLSGEPWYIVRNIPFLDVPFFLFMMWCGGLGSFAVFTATLLLAKATSPVSAVFVNVPRTAFQMVVISLFRGVPKHAWVGVGLCWASSAWYVVARRRERRRDG